MTIITMVVGWRYSVLTFIPLEQNFPMFATSFRKKLFIPKASSGVFKNGFSRMDQIHEQNKKLIKGCGGANGLFKVERLRPYLLENL